MPFVCTNTELSTWLQEPCGCRELLRQFDLILYCWLPRCGACLQTRPCCVASTLPSHLHTLVKLLYAQQARLRGATHAAGASDTCHASVTGVPRVARAHAAPAVQLLQQGHLNDSKNMTQEEQLAGSDVAAAGIEAVRLQGVPNSSCTSCNQPCQQSIHASYNSAHLLICLSSAGLVEAAPMLAAEGRTAVAPMLAAEGWGACSAGVMETHATPAAGALAADACTPAISSAAAAAV
jgi:hypothetical protein